MEGDGDLAGILYPETVQGGIAAVEDPGPVVVPVGAGIEKHLLMVAAQRKDAVSLLDKLHDVLEDLPAPRTPVDIIPQQIEVVLLPQRDDLFDQRS